MQRVKPERAELVRMVERVPRRKAVSWSMIVFVSGLICMLILIFVIIFSAWAGNLSSRSPWPFLTTVLVICSVALRWGLLEQDRIRWFDEAMGKYADQIRADDLVEAMEVTGKEGNGVRLAERLWRGKMGRDFGVIWLTGQCGGRGAGELHRILRGMDGVDEVLDSIRRAENRVTNLGFASAGLMAFMMFSFDKRIAQKIWRDPVALEANRYIIPSIVMGLIVLSYLNGVWQHWRLREEKTVCWPYLMQLPFEDLRVLAGRGRLGRVAKMVLRERA